MKIEKEYQDIICRQLSSIANRCIIKQNSVLLPTVWVQSVIYDHHLLRESKSKERMARVGDVANEGGKRVVAGAEQLGAEPPILRCWGMRCTWRAAFPSQCGVGGEHRR